MASTPQNDKISFNLDTIEREKQYEPFTVNVNGRAITLTDPQELDWQILLAIDQSSQFLRHAINADDREWLRQQKIPGWKFGRLIEAYQRHYGLDDLPNAGGSRI